MKGDSTKADLDDSFPAEALGPFPAACLLAPGEMNRWGSSSCELSRRKKQPLNLHLIYFIKIT